MGEQAKPAALVGRKNIYQCQDCLGIIATIDRDAGTTPFAVPCQARNGCSGMMQSSFYRVPETIKATFEWYRPDNAETALLTPGARQHVDMGGLILRRIVRHEVIAAAVQASLAGSR